MLATWKTWLELTLTERLQVLVGTEELYILIL